MHAHTLRRGRGVLVKTGRTRRDRRREGDRTDKEHTETAKKELELGSSHRGSVINESN